MKQKIQWLLFCCTYPEEVIEAVNQFVTEATCVTIPKEKLSLDHIQQFVIQCPPKGKAEFLVEIYKLLTGTQSFIFVNTRDFVLTLKNILKKSQCNATVMFGDMMPEERDEMMEKFR